MKAIFSRFKTNSELFIIIPIVTILFVMVIYLSNENFENNKHIYYNVYYNSELIGTIDANHLPIGLNSCEYINASYYCKNNLVYRRIK